MRWSDHGHSCAGVADARACGRGFLVRPVGLLDLLEWWGEDGTSHGNWIVVNEEGLEEGNVELATGLVRDCLVVLPWVGGEVKVLTEALGTETEFSSGVSQSILNPTSLELDGVAAVAEERALIGFEGSLFCLLL